MTPLGPQFFLFCILCPYQTKYSESTFSIVSIKESEIEDIFNYTSLFMNNCKIKKIQIKIDMKHFQWWNAKMKRLLMVK